MRTLDLALYVIAAGCFALNALGVGGGRLNLLPVGLLAWVLVPLAHTA